MQDNYSRALGEYNRMAKDGFDKRMKAAGCSDQLLKEAKAKSRLSGDAPDVYDAFVATRWARYMLAHPMEVARAAAPLLARLSDMPRLTQPCPPELGDAPDQVALRTVLEKKIGDQNAACFLGKTVTTATIGGGKTVQDKLSLVSCVLQGEAGRLDIQLPSIESLVGNSKELHDDGKLLDHETQARSCRPHRGPFAPQSATPAPLSAD